MIKNYFSRLLISNILLLIFFILFNKIYSLPIFICLIFIFLISFLNYLPIKNLKENLRKYKKDVYQKESDIVFIQKTEEEIMEEIEKKEKTIKEMKEKIYSFFKFLPTTIFIIDKENKIVFSNRDEEKFIGKNYLEFFDNYNLFECIKDILNDKEFRQSEIEIGNKIFNCHVFKFFDNTVAVHFLDITETYQLKNIKKELVANISHEIKTPLTVIKGYLETIYDEVEGDTKENIKIIMKNTDRLINILDDILCLSYIEEKAIQKENVNLKEITDDIVKIFEKKIKEKEIKVKVDMEIKNSLMTDRLLIESILFNLIDNAIKYTDNGEITIKSKVLGNNLFISIKDTGIGIPEKDIERIFERFYVVDKSRSKETGGTGLGLAIVKNAVISLSGKIEVKSQVGSGTEFIINLPI
ncbi:MAG TPA: HAMP domain-containing sensor histidine kinase [bacterium]|nr:HAMP domain-containing sensor histidine kinase [bacterium]